MQPVLVPRFVDKNYFALVVKAWRLEATHVIKKINLKGSGLFLRFLQNIVIQGATHVRTPKHQVVLRIYQL